MIHLSRRTATLIALVSVLACATLFGIAVLALGMDDKTTAIVTTVLGAFAAAIPSLIAAIKATETADRSAKIQDTQRMESAAHNGNLAPYSTFCPDCPYDTREDRST